MTDEEMAKEYANENKRIYGSDEYADITDYNNVKEAFVAGLKAGREVEREYVKNNAFTSMKEQGLFPFGKWHKVADGDLPKGEEYGKNGIHRKIYLKDRFGSLYTGYYYPKDGNHKADCFAVEFLDWGFYGSQFCEKSQIVEWCEIEG